MHALSPVRKSNMASLLDVSTYPVSNLQLAVWFLKHLTTEWTLAAPAKLPLRFLQGAVKAVELSVLTICCAVLDTWRYYRLVSSNKAHGWRLTRNKFISSPGYTICHVLRIAKVLAVGRGTAVSCLRLICTSHAFGDLLELQKAIVKVHASHRDSAERFPLFRLPQKVLLCFLALYASRGSELDSLGASIRLFWTRKVRLTVVAKQHHSLHLIYYWRVIFYGTLGEWYLLKYRHTFGAPQDM